MGHARGRENPGMALDLRGTPIYPRDIVGVAMSSGSTPSMVLVEVLETRKGMGYGGAAHGGWGWDIKGIPLAQGTHYHIKDRDPKPQRYEGTARMVLVERRSFRDEAVQEAALQELLDIAKGRI